MYLSKSEGSRGLLGVQNTVETAVLWLRNYVKNTKERFLIVARTMEEEEGRDAPNECKNKKKNERETQ